MAKYEWNRPTHWQLGADQHRLPSPEQHRRSITELLINSITTEPATLLVLGAGPANDLHLPQLASKFAKIQLVDLRLELMQEALRVQGVSESPQFSLREMELTGVLELIKTWSPTQPPAAAELDRALALIRECHWTGLDLPVDVSVSTCLLSQLILAVVRQLGDQHPRFVEFIQAIRARHLELLLGTVRPGGTALLIFDFVSSDSLAEIATQHGVELQQTLARALETNNFFHGMHPLKMLSLAREYPPVAAQVESAALSLPWIWNAGPRQYAVCCLRMRRKNG